MSAPPRPAPAAPSLLDRLDAAAESGDVDARQLADAIGLTVAGLRTALARPALLAAEHAPVVAAALGLDANAVRALRRAGASAAPAPGEAPALAAPGGPPPTLVALLEGSLRAVAGDDATAAALRRAVLDVAAAAAREAGRVLPPGAHELRAREARGEFARAPAPPDAGRAGEAGGDAGARDHPGDAALVAAAAALVGELQAAAPRYDGLFAPLDDAGVDDLLRRHGIAVHAVDGLPGATRTVLTPPIFGRHRLLRPAGATADQRRLTARVALAHLLAGHAGEDAPLPSPAPNDDARLAELVALADLVPFWQVSDARRRGRLGWRALVDDAARHAATLAGDWDGERAADRGALRVALFRTHAL